MPYRNAAHAFVGELEQIQQHGRPVTVRGAGTRELLARTVVLDHPRERFITIPGRRNDVFATIAETMWVLAGREDVGFLSRYLKRAGNYSDDGLTWRGAYGPRLRDWAGVDQVGEVRSLLQSDPESRRAAIVLFDPARDYQHDTKDVPCNNWLHFLRREGRLDLQVVIRSNDILWGFSGINTFEWSVLHEMMAFWLGAEVGRVSFFISSLHLYDEFAERGATCVANFSGQSGYERGWQPVSFATDWDAFAGAVEDWFKIADSLSAGEDVADRIAAFEDPLLRQFLRALEVKAAVDRGALESELRELVDGLGHTDLAYALHEQLFRDSANLDAATTEPTDSGDLRAIITELHRSKDASYGNSWKRRGEQVSILANIARKADRIENVTAGAPSGSEALIDTAADLFVYALKYETYLADADPTVETSLFGDTAGGRSDGPEGFTALIDTLNFDMNVDELASEAQAAIQAFARLDEFVRTGSPTAEAKATEARALTTAALRLVIAVATNDPSSVNRLRAETGV